MYGLLVLWFMVMVLWIKTDNTAYQALVLVWLWCGNNIVNVLPQCGKLTIILIVQELINPEPDQ